MQNIVYQINRCLKSFVDDLVITCDEIIVTVTTLCGDALATVWMSLKYKKQHVL